MSANTVSIHDAGPSRKRLAITIPAKTVDDSLGLSLEALANQAELPGFRKGRAPKRLIEKRFGGAISRQAKETLMGQAFQAAVAEHKLRVLGNPMAKDLDSVELAPGKPFSFELEVEVLPEFELPALDGIKVLKPQMDVTNEMVTSSSRATIAPAWPS
jgi:trigger factor